MSDFLTKTDFNIELPDDVYDHYAAIARAEGIKVEVLLSQVASDGLKKLVAQMETQDGV